MFNFKDYRTLQKSKKTVKNYLFSKRPNNRLLILMLLGLLWAQSCQKNENTKGKEPEFDFSINYRDPDPLSEQAFNEVVSNDYELQGKQVYDHLKFRFATASPEDFIPVASRQIVLQSLQEQAIADAGKSFEQKVNDRISSGYLTQNEGNLLIDLKQTVNSMENNSNLTFGQAWYAIRNWEIATINNSSISEDEKQAALITASGLRNLMKYEYETGAIAEERASGCFLGRTLDCWINALGSAVIGWINAAVKAVGQGGGGFTIAALLTAAFKKVVWQAAGIALALEVVKIFIQDKCKFDVSQSSIGCAKPKGISMEFGDCNTLEQRFMAWGYQTDGSSVFNWVVQNGVFPDDNNNLTITTISPEVRVRQNDPNVPVQLAVAISCDPTKYLVEQNISLPDMVNSPGNISIVGPVDVNLSTQSAPHIETYEFWGSWRANQNSTIISAGCTEHGHVTEHGDDYIKVEWIKTTPAYPPPTVYAIANNFCSNNSVTQNLYVTIHQ